MWTLAYIKGVINYQCPSDATLFSKSALSRGSATVAEHDVAGAHLQFPGLHTWQYKVNYGSWWLLSLPQRTAPRDSAARFLSLFWRRISVGEQLPALPHLSSPIHPPFTESLSGTLVQAHPCLFPQSVGMFKVLGCQWDKVNSTEVLKKIKILTLCMVSDWAEGSIVGLGKKLQGDTGEGVILRTMWWCVDYFDQKVP